MRRFLRSVAHDAVALGSSLAWCILYGLVVLAICAAVPVVMVLVLSREWLDYRRDMARHRRWLAVERARDVQP